MPELLVVKPWHPPSIGQLFASLFVQKRCLALWHRTNRCAEKVVGD